MKLKTLLKAYINMHNDIVQIKRIDMNNKKLFCNMLISDAIKYHGDEQIEEFYITNDYILSIWLRS